MKTFVPHKMLALSLSTQVKLNKQILRDKHDAILNSFVLNMKQMLVDKEFIAFDKERSDKFGITKFASSINEMLYDIETLLHNNSLDINAYFDRCVSSMFNTMHILTVALRLCPNFLQSSSTLSLLLYEV